MSPIETPKFRLVHAEAIINIVLLFFMRSIGTERLRNLMADAVSDEEKGSALGQLQSTEHRKVQSQQLWHYSPVSTASIAFQFWLNKVANDRKQA